MKKSILFSNLILFSCFACSNPPINVNFDGKSTLNFQNGKVIKKIKIGEINGYKSNCSNSYLVIWGIPKKFNDSSPQNNEIIFYNLNNNQQRVVKTSHAIFDVNFYKTKDNAILSLSTTNTEINLKTGKQSDLSEINQSTLNQLEDCKNVIQFKRYK